MVYGIVGRLFVEQCPACGEASPGGFCSACAAEFVRIESACARCGLPRPVAHCPRLHIPWAVDALIAPFAYRPPLDYYVQALKYRGARAMGRAFGLLLAAEAGPALTPVDAFVAVPLHRARRLERGYNQAQEIARTLARLLRRRALERGIVRRTLTTQTGHRAVDRRAGAASAFRVARDLSGCRVAIVDDVVTTGATVNGLAAALRAAGAARCIALAVARTPEPDQPRNV